MPIFNIPSSYPFLRSLAEGVLRQADQSGIAIEDFTIILPTRRACRELQLQFLQITHGKPLILPRLLPLGDLDADELALSGAIANHIPQAISPLRRTAILAQMIGDFYAQKHKRDLGYSQAWILAGSLAQFLDQVYIEERDFAQIHSLAAEQYAQHWQDITEFLSLLPDQWQPMLEKMGYIDQQQRRILLLRGHAEWISKNPPQKPIIVAGSTGSMLAAADFMRAVAATLMGSVLLPGLDTFMNPNQWSQIESTHPQFFLKRFLEGCEKTPDQISNWPFLSVQPQSKAEQLWSWALLPPEATPAWQNIAISQDHIGNLQLIECDGVAQESAIIALLLREAVQNKDKTAALVTPDRNLARRVAAQLKKWDIDIDDSAGISVSETPSGQLLLLCLKALTQNFAPDVFMALLKHAVIDPQLWGDKPYFPQAMEIALRQKQDWIFSPHRGLEQYSAAFTEDFQKPLQQLSEAFAPLQKAILSGAHPFKDWLQWHIDLASALCGNSLWKGDFGEAAWDCIAELSEAQNDFPPLHFSEYEKIISRLFLDKTARQKFPGHPRLHILGLLEARMIHADRIIAAGLNENIWPPASDADPWMSRPMRKEFGLPSRERRIGQSAHDLVQLAAQNAEIFITRSIRNGGELCLASRFWVRLCALLESKKKLAAAQTAANLYKQWVVDMDSPAQTIQIQPPAPTPPIAARPMDFSVTAVELWMRDPYAFYARYILHLRALRPFSQQFHSAERGIFLHGCLEEFFKSTPPKDFAQAQAQLHKIAQEKLSPWAHDAYVQSAFWPRAKKILDWFLQTHFSALAQLRQSWVEIRGELALNINGTAYRLSAKADRIDLSRANRVDIIDYKTGQPPSAEQMKYGFAPQLPLLGAILRAGGFPEIQSTDLQSLQFWHLHGKDDGGEIKLFEKDIALISEDALRGLKQLITQYQNPAQAYSSAPHGQDKIRNSDYNLLARSPEWDSAEDAA